jgi:hypothetical protein
MEIRKIKLYEIIIINGWGGGATGDKAKNILKNK